MRNEVKFVELPRYKISSKSVYHLWEWNKRDISLCSGCKHIFLTISGPIYIYIYIYIYTENIDVVVALQTFILEATSSNHNHATVHTGWEFSVFSCHNATVSLAPAPPFSQFLSTYHLPFAIVQFVFCIEYSFNL